MGLFNWFKMVVGGVVPKSVESADTEADTVDLPVPVQRTLRIEQAHNGIRVSWSNNSATILTTAIGSATLKYSLRNGGYYVPSNVYSTPVTYADGHSGQLGELITLLTREDIVDQRGDSISLVNGVVLL